MCFLQPPQGGRNSYSVIRGSGGQEVRRSTFGVSRVFWRCFSLRSHLNPLDPLRHHVGVMHGDQRHLDSGHLAQFGGPHTCGQRSREQSDDVES